MTEHILDAKITKVYKGSSGEGQYGPYTIYNFYTDKTGKSKFSYICGGNKPVPKDGMTIKHMEFEEVRDGQYTNLKVKKLELPDEIKPKSKSESKPEPKQENGTIDKNVSFWTRYMADVCIAIISRGDNLNDYDLDIIAEKIGRAGLVMEATLKCPQVNKNLSPIQKEEKQVSDTTEKQLRAKFKRFAKADSEKYFEIMGLHGCENAEEAIMSFTQETRENLIRDLEKNISVS